MASGPGHDPGDYRLGMFRRLLDIPLDYRKVPRSPGVLFRAAAPLMEESADERDFCYFPQRNCWPYGASPGACSTRTWTKVFVFTQMYKHTTVMSAAAARLATISGADKVFEHLAAYENMHLTYVADVLKKLPEASRATYYGLPRASKKSYLDQQLREVQAVSQSAVESRVESAQEVVCVVCMDEMPRADLRKTFCFTPNCQVVVCHGCVDRIVESGDKKCPTCREAYDSNQFQMTGRLRQPTSVSVQQAPEDLRPIGPLKQMYDQLDIDFTRIPKYILQDYANVLKSLDSAVALFNSTDFLNEASTKALVDARSDLMAAVVTITELGNARGYDDFTYINHPRPVTRSILAGGKYHRLIDDSRERLIDDSDHFINLTYWYMSKYEVVSLRKKVDIIRKHMLRLGYDQSQLLPQLPAMMFFSELITEKVKSAIAKAFTTDKVRKAEFDLECTLKEGDGAPSTRRLKKGDGGWSRQD